MVQSVLGNLVNCQREFGIRRGENGRLVDNEGKPLFLRWDATPMTRGCIRRPLIDLITKIFDFFLKWLGFPTMEEEHVLGIADRSFKELIDKIGIYKDRPPNIEEANLFREEREVYEKIREAALLIWENQKERPRTPSMIQYQMFGMNGQINAILQAAR